MLGVGITDAPSLTSGGALTAPPGPAALFAAAEAGFWFNPSDAATRFQDTAGTIPAGDGDLIGLLRDQSGNANDATQPVSTARPMVHAAPGLHYFENDGVDDDGLILNSGVMVRTFYCAAQYKDGTTAAFDGFSTIFTKAARNVSAGRCMGRNGYPSLYGSDFVTGINGAPVSSDPVLPLPWGIMRIEADDQSLFEVGAMFGANFNNISRQWVGRFTPLLAIDRILTAAEDTNLRAYFAPRIGTPA